MPPHSAGSDGLPTIFYAQSIDMFAVHCTDVFLTMVVELDSVGRAAPL